MCILINCEVIAFSVTYLGLSGNYFSFFHRDGKMPVTFIQKYLVKKLELTSEAEVSLFLLPSNKFISIITLCLLYAF